MSISNSGIQPSFPQAYNRLNNPPRNVSNKRKITELLSKVQSSGIYGSAQEKAANWLLRLASGDKSVLNELQKKTSQAVFNDSNASPLKDFLGQNSVVSAGFNLGDPYSGFIDADLKTNTLFSERRFLSYFLDVLRQNVPGVQSLLQEVFGLSKEDSQSLAADLLTAVNEKFPDLVATLNQESQRIQSTENYLSQNKTILGSMKQANDQILTKAITFGGGGNG